jgi:C-3',4' desaturase CrtD
MKTRSVLVIGAGIGGLTAAALLLKQGWQVTVLEAGTYPGGCAGTFFHKGYRFDAGATLAAGFASCGPHARVAEILGLEWPVEPIRDAAWVTHLPGHSIHQWVDPVRWREEYLVKLPFSARFWQKQEQLAKIAWNLSSRDFPWPPATLGEAARLPLALRPETLAAAPYLFGKMSHLLPRETTPDFKAFVDGNLLISAQAISDHADALYGSSVLDLPRRGVMHVRGGMGAIAERLVHWIQANGGQVKYRQRVTRLETAAGRVRAAITAKQMRFEADVFLANLTPWALETLLGEAAPGRLRRETRTRPWMWGAFVVHAGVRAEKISHPITHHQVIMDVNQPLGEGNSVFISLSPLDDPSRAPTGMRSVILSTHTRIADWQGLNETAYEQRKAAYAEKVLTAAERALPGFRAAAELILTGAPQTYEFFTRRPFGMVGGFPQTSLFAARGPQTGLRNLWLVGDSIFPGQSTAGVTLGALRMAKLVNVTVNS